MTEFSSTKRLESCYDDRGKRNSTPQRPSPLNQVWNSHWVCLDEQPSCMMTNEHIPASSNPINLDLSTKAILYQMNQGHDKSDLDLGSSTFTFTSAVLKESLGPSNSLDSKKKASAATRAACGLVGSSHSTLKPLIEANTLQPMNSSVHNQYGSAPSHESGDNEESKGKFRAKTLPISSPFANSYFVQYTSISNIYARKRLPMVAELTITWGDQQTAVAARRSASKSRRQLLPFKATSYINPTFSETRLPYSGAIDLNEVKPIRIPQDGLLQLIIRSVDGVVATIFLIRLDFKDMPANTRTMLRQHHYARLTEASKRSEPLRHAVHLSCRREAPSNLSSDSLAGKVLLDGNIKIVFSFDHSPFASESVEVKAGMSEKMRIINDSLADPKYYPLTLTPNKVKKTSTTEMNMESSNFVTRPNSPHRFCEYGDICH